MNKEEMKTLVINNLQLSIDNFTNGRLSKQINDLKKDKDFELMDGNLNNEDGRYQSWNLLRNVFKKKVLLSDKITKEDKEMLSLSIYTYLGSWGMFRASLLMKRYNYKVIYGVTDICIKYKYLYNLNSIKQLKDNIENISELYLELDEEFSKKGFKKRDTLVTKVMLGVFGCSPAYDTNIVKCIDAIGIKSLNLKGESKRKASFIEHKDPKKSKEQFTESMLGLIKWMEDIKFVDKYYSNELKKEYPLMKVVDMSFFETGLLVSLIEQKEKNSSN